MSFDVRQFWFLLGGNARSVVYEKGFFDMKMRTGGYVSDSEGAESFTK